MPNNSTGEGRRNLIQISFSRVQPKEQKVFSIALDCNRNKGGFFSGFYTRSLCQRWMSHSGICFLNVVVNFQNLFLHAFCDALLLVLHV